MDSSAEYANTSPALGGIPRKFCVVRYGSGVGTISAVPPIIAEFTIQFLLFIYLRPAGLHGTMRFGPSREGLCGVWVCFS
jgi:hypothetical protein